MGIADAVVNLRTKWPNNDKVQQGRMDKSNEVDALYRGDGDLVSCEVRERSLFYIAPIKFELEPAKHHRIRGENTSSTGMKSFRINRVRRTYAVVIFAFTFLPVC